MPPRASHDLQMQTIPFVQELARAGARDFSCRYLGSCVEPFIEFLQNDAQESSGSHGPQLPIPELRELRVVLQDVLTTLDELALPETVGHMDLNPQNIICSDRECVFLDWAEAFIGCPFFSFEYLLQQFRRAFPSQSAMERTVSRSVRRSVAGSISPAICARRFTFTTRSAVRVRHNPVALSRDEQRIATLCSNGNIFSGWCERCAACRSERKGVAR